MHFSIPDTTEVKDGKSTYTNFNMHVNGVFFGAVRYSQLHDFNEQLKKEDMDLSNLSPFPGKKQTLLTLTPYEIDERREELEEYLQSVSQDPVVSKCDLLNNFLLCTQQDAFREENKAVELDIFLSNGRKVTVDIMAMERADIVLEIVAKKIDLPEKFTYYFGLFVVLVEEDDSQLIMRKLQDFEAPYVSLKFSRQMAEAGKVNSNYRIVIRKWYWDTSFDADVMESKVGCNLLFVQTVADVENGWVMAPKASLRQLKQIQSKGERKKYVELAKGLHHYGHVQFLPVTTDFPKSNTRATVSIGPKELCMQIMTEGGQSKEVAFKVTRMRCWKITSLVDDSSALMAKECRLELAFDYLFTKDKLQWVRLVGPQAIFMSSCLGSIVAELIRKNSGGSVVTPSERQRKPLEAYSFKRNAAGAGLEYIEQCRTQMEQTRAEVSSTGTPPETRRDSPKQREPKVSKPQQRDPESSKSRQSEAESSKPRQSSGGGGTSDDRDGKGGQLDEESQEAENGEVFSREPLSPGSVTSEEPSSRQVSTSGGQRHSTSSYTQLGQTTVKDRFKNFVVQGLTSQQGGVSTVGRSSEGDPKGAVFDTIDDEDL